jgi:hypothetical protein
MNNMGKYAAGENQSFLRTFERARHVWYMNIGLQLI